MCKGNCKDNTGYIYKAVTALIQKKKEIKEMYSLKSLSIKSLCIFHAVVRNFAQVSVLWGLRPKSTLYKIFSSGQAKKPVKTEGEKSLICGSW